MLVLAKPQQFCIELNFFYLVDTIDTIMIDMSYLLYHLISLVSKIRDNLINDYVYYNIM